MALILGALLAPAAHAHEPMELAEIQRAFGMELESVEITAEKVRDGLYVIFGAGGNIAVSIGDDGVLIVDDQFPELVPRILEKIQQLGGGSPDFVVNTHWHFDHAQGNLELGKTHAVIVSHEHSRQRMRSDQTINLVQHATLQKAYPPHALPDVTFDRRMRIHWNGEAVELFHTGRAHTNGDTAVLFRGHNALHTGDVYNNSGYPFIDVDNGGGIDGMIAFCEAMLEATDADTVVIPGHGPLSDPGGLTLYIGMLTAVRDGVARMIEDGASFEEIVAAKPTDRWDEKNGDPSGFLDRVYHSLLRAEP